MKKIAIQYGLIITAGVMAWVLIAHSIFPPQSPVHSIGAMAFFNILHFVVIFLGISAYRRLENENLSFKQSIKLGVAISFVYGLTASIFFSAVIMVVGDKWLAAEPGAQQLPTKFLLLQAFAGLFISALVFGLIYSTVISFAVAKRVPRST
jgi:hypothetical protein